MNKSPYTPQTQRLSGLELLRLIAMLGIVLSHWGGHGSWNLSSDNTFIINKIWLQLCQFFGEVGNCIFFLITGYFTYNRETINKKGIIRLILDVKFYAFSVWLVALALGVYSFSFGGLTKYLFPIVFKQYWFVLPFLTVCAIAPWINDILRKSTPKTLKWYFVIMILIEMILPLIGAITISSNVGLFILVYSIGAIIKKEEKLFSFVNRYRLLLIGCGYGIAIGSLYFIDLMCAKLGISCDYSMVLISRFSFVPILASLGLFLVFKQKRFTNSMINYCAQGVLSVYLISEHPYIHPWFWKSNFDNMDFYYSIYLIPISIGQCIIVMVACLIIDTLYRIIKQQLANVINCKSL